MMDNEQNLGKEVPLQEWINNNPVHDKMYWKTPFDHQVMFVRDRLVPLFGAGLTYEQQKQIATVISTHRSKSIKLPVYLLTRPDQNLQIVLRDNFYNWKISVLSETPIQADFAGLFYTTPPLEPDYTGEPLHPVYFEGFPRNLIFPYYSETDGRRWSAEIDGDETLWTSIFLMMRSLENIKPMVWHTRESHRKKLGLDSKQLM